MFRITVCLLMMVLLAPVVQASASVPPAPVHHWKFDETSGVVAEDWISGNDGTLNNWGLAEPRWVAGRIGGALDFGDTNNYVITDSAIPFDQYTIAFWLKVHAKEGTNPRLTSPIDGYDGVWITIQNDGNRGVGFTYTQARDPNPPIPGLWEHYAVVFDRVGGEAVIYRDGGEVARGSFADDLPVGRWYFGHQTDINNHGDSLNGQMDDLRIYNRLLEVDDIRALIPPAPSIASFSTTLETVYDIDFGTLTQGDFPPAEAFGIWNLADPTSGADLDLLSIDGIGDLGQFVMNLSPFTDFAPGSFDLFTASMDTSTGGDFSATYELNFSDELGTDQLLTLSLTGTVVPEPSNASFASSSDLDELNIDFGTFNQGDFPPAEQFEIWNIADPVKGADLDLLSINGSGDTSVLTTTLSPFTDLAAGDYDLYTASMDTSTPGDFSATYALSFTDELGTDQLLTLSLSGSVVPEPSTLVLLGIGAVVLFAWYRRRRWSRPQPESARFTREVL